MIARPPDPLSPYALERGIKELRRILDSSCGYYHAGSIVPYCLEAKQDALRALDTLEREARLWRVSREVRRALDVGADVEVPLDGRVA